MRANLWSVVLLVVGCTEVGPRGPQGERGPAGAAGPKGDVGPAGAQGEQGVKGETGSTSFSVFSTDGGAVVVDGGLVIVEGPSGPQGVQGIQGAIGPQGKDGASPAVVVVPSGNSNCSTGGVSVSPTDGGPPVFVCNGQKGDQGIQGSAGPMGGGLYVTKNLTYCNVDTLSASGPVVSTIATCADANDLPLAGGCETVDAAARLVQSTPENWSVQSSLSRWTCSWNGATTGASFTARICCLTVL